MAEPSDDGIAAFRTVVRQRGQIKGQLSRFQSILDSDIVNFRKLPTGRLRDKIGMPLDAGCPLKHIV
nr:unnamed protein product [Callosobruchus analis]